jgi:hypothetical protein
VTTTCWSEGSELAVEAPRETSEVTVHDLAGLLQLSEATAQPKDLHREHDDRDHEQKNDGRHRISPPHGVSGYLLESQGSPIGATTSPW